MKLKKKKLEGTRFKKSPWVWAYKGKPTCLPILLFWCCLFRQTTCYLFNQIFLSNDTDNTSSASPIGLLKNQGRGFSTPKKWFFNHFLTKKHLQNNLETYINLFMPSNNTRIGPKTMNQIESRKFFEVRSTFSCNSKMKEHPS
jgi:hypothetical protein